MPTNPNAADDALASSAGDTDGDPNVANVGQSQETGKETTGSQPGDDWKAKYEAAQASLEELNAKLDAKSRESNEWMTRFTGMQGKYQQEKKKWEESAGDLSKLPDQLSGLQTQFNDLQSMYDESQTQILALQTEKEIAEHSLERKNIIFKEFPGLIPFEADGLLPDGTGDEFREKLSAFNEKMTKIGGDAFEAIVAGSSPPQPKSSETLGTQEILNEALKSFREGDMETYDNLYGQYLQKVDNVKE